MILARLRSGQKNKFFFLAGKKFAASFRVKGFDKMLSSRRWKFQSRYFSYSNNNSGYDWISSTITCGRRPIKVPNTWNSLRSAKRSGQQARSTNISFRCRKPTYNCFALTFSRSASWASVRSPLRFFWPSQLSRWPLGLAADDLIYLSGSHFPFSFFFYPFRFWILRVIRVVVDLALVNRSNEFFP